MGDPKGIGPEITAKAWKSLDPDIKRRLLIYGDMSILDEAAKRFGTSFELKQQVISSSTKEQLKYISDLEAARLTISAIDAASADALSGKIGALVTAPVSKNRVQLVKKSFLGHTEYLAQKAHVKDPVMMFICINFPNERGSCQTGRMCFSLATTHLPIKDVSKNITVPKILTAIRRTQATFEKQFKCPDARIAVMALNPHAGEAGILGLEEKSAIAPAIERALKEGINCVGPISANALFNNMDDFDFDAVIAMYHDQAVSPMKILCQNKFVNMTLGLPYIRTSPSHGTAEDIAWLGTADETGMIEAIKLAAELAQGETR